jgi:signal peptidase I
MKKFWLILMGMIGLVAVVAGGAYALEGNRSDVGKPEPTPETDMVKFQVVGTSMEPTIRDGDWLLVQTGVKSLKVGDVIVMRAPGDTSKLYCRRVVAVGGDKVVMKYFSNVKATTVYGPGSSGGVTTPVGVAPIGNAYGEYDTTVDSGSFYVTGDNTAPGGSYDSDEWGLLPLGDVVGVVKSRTSPNPRTF